MCRSAGDPLSNGRRKVRLVETVAGGQDLRWIRFAQEGVDYVEEAVHTVTVIVANRDEGVGHPGRDTDGVLDIEVL